MSNKRRDSSPESRVGATVGRYRLESVLGVGGMGIVYRASGPDDKWVAIKLIKEDYARDETFLRRFSREARIAQTVSNPHVVRVLDTGEHDGLPYLASVFIEGGSLEQRLDRARPLDVGTSVRICAQVADGLEALSAAGMVHRDIKPGNILLDFAENAYITDFGIAKDSQGTALTRPGQALGSMDYMSPEQIRGEEVTAATDIYALGCVIFECIDGRPPFADYEGMQVLWAHLREEPPDLTGEELPPAFARALNVALRKRPSERPRTAVEFARSLAQAAGITT